MTSSTFSSRTVLAAFTVGMAAFVTALCAGARHPVARENGGSCLTYSCVIRDAVEKRRPDIVLIGNSTLYENVDEPTLEAELSRLTGRPIKTLIAGLGGSGLPWCYLVIKNQLLETSVRGIPVGIFHQSGRQTEVRLPPAQETLWGIKKILRNDDEVFFRKTGSRELWDRISFKTSLGRHESGRVLMSTFSRLLTLSAEAPETLINERFRLRAMDERAFMNRAFLKGIRPPDMEGCRTEDCFDDTFLPDIAAFAPAFRLFTVEVHGRPPVVESAEDRAYRARVQAYLRERGIPSIGLAGRRELDDPSLYTYTDHLAREGTVLNARIVAEEIVNAGLLSPAPVALSRS